MRILHVIAELDHGGAERVVLQLAGDGRSHGDRVAVASTPGAWEDRLRQLGATHLPLPLAPRSAAATVRAAPVLAGAIRRFEPTVVHAHNVRATVTARSALLLARRRVPLLTTVHGLAPEDHGRAARILRRCGTQIVACAPGVRDDLLRTGVAVGAVDVVINGQGLCPADPERARTMRADLGLGDGPVVVGVGRLEPSKNWTELIDVAARLPNVQFVVAGAGSQRASLEAEAARRSGKVRFVGAVDDVAALLGMASCFVSTSDREGLSMALLEAFSLGMPAVVTAVGGLPELLPADAAVLVPPRDPPAMAEQIRDVLSNPSRARALGAAGQRAASAWTTAAMTASYRERYLRAERSRSGRRRRRSEPR